MTNSDARLTTTLYTHMINTDTKLTMTLDAQMTNTNADYDPAHTLD